MAASRFSFKSLLGFGRKSAQGSISHPSQMDPGNNDYGMSIVSSAQAMRVAAVNTCVTKLANIMAMFPVAVYRPGTGMTLREQMKGHWLTKLLAQPMRGMSYWSWMWLLEYHMAFRGKIFCRKVWSRGRVVELQPINPDRVQVYRDNAGDLRFDIYHMNRPIERGLTEEHIWYVMAATLDGTNGVGPIDLQRELFESGMSLQQYAENALKNDGFTGLVFSFAGRLRPETREALKKDWEEKNAGPKNAGRPLLMEDGGKAERLTMTLEQAQFIESRKMSRIEIAAMFGFPPHLIGELENSNFNSLEQLSSELLTFTVQPICTMWEHGYKALLGDEAFEQEIFVKFNMNSLARGDMKSRYESYASAISAQWMLPNEAREKEDMHTKIPGGDQPVKKPDLADSTGKPENPTKPRNDDR